MMNIEKFKKLVSKDVNNTLERNRERIENRENIRQAQKYAIQILFNKNFDKEKFKKELNIEHEEMELIVKGKWLFQRTINRILKHLENGI